MSKANRRKFKKSKFKNLKKTLSISERERERLSKISRSREAKGEYVGVVGDILLRFSGAASTVSPSIWFLRRYGVTEMMKVSFQTCTVEPDLRERKTYKNQI